MLLKKEKFDKILEDSYAIHDSAVRLEKEGELRCKDLSRLSKDY